MIGAKAMATRYYANPEGTTIYASPNPTEHKPVVAAGFRAFSPWYAMQYDDLYRKNGDVNKSLPTGFTIADMQTLTTIAKGGNFGTFEKVNGRLVFVGSRYVKTGRGKYELHPRGSDATSGLYGA